MSLFVGEECDCMSVRSLCEECVCMSVRSVTVYECDCKSLPHYCLWLYLMP